MKENRKYTTINKKSFHLARIIMEKHLKRGLTTHEKVHHKDRNPANNSIDNLEVLSAEQHFWKHIEMESVQLPFGGVSRSGLYLRKISTDPNKAWCSRCKQFLDKANFAKSSRRWNGLANECKKCKRDWDKEQYKKKIIYLKENYEQRGTA